MTELTEWAASYGIELTAEMEGQFSRYCHMLLDWNKVMNLTAITEPSEVMGKHFLDSLLASRCVEGWGGKRLIDVGTGAGFPGIPLGIWEPSLELTLLDSLQKRLAFLRAVSAELGQANRFLHGRAEDWGRDPAHREQYDIATARAVAPLPVLLELCLPFVAVGGSFLAMKAAGAEEELARSAAAMEALGCVLAKRHDFTLPDGSRRTILRLEKISQTPTQYPRKPAKIQKAPL